MGAPADETLRRKIIGAVLQISIVQLFKGFIYKFGGKYFLQVGGGPTGARVTMAAVNL